MLCVSAVSMEGEGKEEEATVTNDLSVLYKRCGKKNDNDDDDDEEEDDKDKVKDPNKPFHTAHLQITLGLSLYLSMSVSLFLSLSGMIHIIILVSRCETRV